MLEQIANYVRKASGLPELLEVSFQAFESIRLATRSCEEQIPYLLATFMTAADAAVDGREAIAAAPSLDPVISGKTAHSAPAAGDVAVVIGALGALGILLDERLADGAALATSSDDRTACLAAAAAARRIAVLMARDSHDSHPG